MDPLATYRNEIQNYGTWTPQLEAAAQEYMASPEYQKAYADAYQRYQMNTTGTMWGENGPPPFDPDNPLSPYAVNPYVTGSTWDGNVQTIQYRDGTSHTNAPYEESYGFGGLLGDITKYAAIGGVALGTGYMAGGLSGLWGAPELAASAFSPEELALATSGASFTGGVPGVTTAAATAAGQGLLETAATFTPEELALGTSGASFTGGVPGVTTPAATLAGQALLAPAATSGLTAMQKLLLTQQGIRAASGVTGSLAGGGETGMAGPGMTGTGMRPGSGLLSPPQAIVPQYALNQIKLPLPKDKEKDWQYYAQQARSTQSPYWGNGGFLA